jgi:predicted nucleotidyltransferase
LAEITKDYVESIHVKNRTLELQEELERCIKVLKDGYDPERIVLFGSLVNDNVKRWSDIDLVIIKDTNQPFLDRIKEIILLLQPKVGIDILVYTPSEFRNLCATRFFLKHEICVKGRIVYERGGSKLD